MTKIYLARHGQDQDNANGILNGHRDEPLTDLGRGQASILAKNIKEHDLHIDKIFSSPLKRAYETAGIVAGALGLNQPIKLESLIERDFGTMAGKPTADIEKLCAPDIIPTDTVTYFLSPPGAETFPQLLDRAAKVLEYIKSNCQDETVLLVTHGDVGKMLYAAYYHLEWQDVLKSFHFGNSDLLLLADNHDRKGPHIFKVIQYNL